MLNSFKHVDIFVNYSAIRGVLDRDVILEQIISFCIVKEIDAEILLHEYESLHWLHSSKNGLWIVTFKRQEDEHRIYKFHLIRSCAYPTSQLTWL